MNGISPMKQFMALFGVGFRSMTTGMSVGRSSKKKRRAISGMGAVVFLCILCVYISIMYSMMFAESLAALGALDVMLLLMLVIGCGFMFLFTVFSAQSVVFGGRDNELLFSLPVSPFLVMLSKISAVYVENLLMGFFFTAPPAVIYVMYGGGGGLPFFLMLLLGILFLPMVPSVLSLLFGWVVSVISAKMQNKTLLTNALSLVLTVGLFIFIFGATQNLDNILGNPDGIRSALSFFLPAVWMADAAVHLNLTSLAYLALSSVLPLMLVVFLLSRRYQRTVTALRSHSIRSDYRLTRVKASSQMASLIKREAGRYFGIFIYWMNTGFGMILLLLGAVFACVKADTILQTLNMVGFGGELLPYLAGACMCMFVSLSGTTYVSISLEGKTLGIIKSMPVSTWRIFSSKMLWNLIVVLPIVTLSAVSVGLAFGLGVTGILISLALPVSYALFITTFGLFVNLLMPKLDAPNDAATVKQSGAAFVGTMGPMLLATAGIILYFTVFLDMLPITLYYWCCAGISLLAAAVFLLVVRTWGQKRFAQFI